MPSNPPCIDLRERFGDAYRIGHDDSAATCGERRDPWMMTLLCQRGVIYPAGGDTLAVEIDGRPGVAKQVAAIPGVRVFQWGERERTLHFDVALFDRVAEIVRPRKRRRCHLTAEQLKAGGERLARLRGESKDTGAVPAA